MLPAPAPFTTSITKFESHIIRTLCYSAPGLQMQLICAGLMRICKMLLCVS
jgi:hypothetical protein